jgi:hypothetical protein
MGKSFLFMILAVLLFYKGRSQQNSPAVHIGFFSAIPKEIDGCVGTYTYDTTLLKKEKYILITNLQKLAMIRIDGVTVFLQQVSHSQPAEHTFRNVYKANGYTIVVIEKDIKDVGDEGSYERGTMEIKYGAIHVIYKIHGTAGC